jgi:hypothetical protein
MVESIAQPPPLAPAASASSAESSECDVHLRHPLEAHCRIGELIAMVSSRAGDSD